MRASSVVGAIIAFGTLLSCTRPDYCGPIQEAGAESLSQASEKIKVGVPRSEVESYMDQNGYIFNFIDATTIRENRSQFDADQIPLQIKLSGYITGVAEVQPECFRYYLGRPYLSVGAYFDQQNRVVHVNHRIVYSD